MVYNFSIFPTIPLGKRAGTAATSMRDEAWRLA